MKKLIGLLVITVLTGSIFFVIYKIVFNQSKDLKSPLPLEKGIKVIYISPTTSQ